MTATIRALGPGDLLAYLPYRLGFRPAESVVFVSLQTSGKVGVVVRVDLSDLAGGHGESMAAAIAGHLRADGAQECVLALYTSMPVDDPARLAVQRSRRAITDSVGPVDVWVVSATGYAELDCADRACCPESGRPLHELQSSAVAAEMVFAGIGVAASREDALGIPRAPAAARRRAWGAAERARRRVHRARLTAGLLRWHLESFEVWMAAFAEMSGRGCAKRGSPAGQRASEVVAGHLEVALESRTFRDGLVLFLVTGTEELSIRMLRQADTDQATAAAVAGVVDPARAVRPDPAIVGPATRILESVVAHGVVKRQAPALTLLGLIAWWSGDGVRASSRVSAALAVDPDYQLARLLSGAIAGGVTPGWVRAPADSGSGSGSLGSVTS